MPVSMSATVTRVEPVEKSQATSLTAGFSERLPALTFSSPHNCPPTNEASLGVAATDGPAVDTSLDPSRCIGDPERSDRRSNVSNAACRCDGEWTRHFDAVGVGRHHNLCMDSPG